MKDIYKVLKNPIIAILLFFILIYSCQPGDQSLGLNMIPGVGTIETRYYKDKDSIYSFTYSDEKIRVNLPKYNIIGSFNDPIFGYTSGYFAAQYRMNQYPNFESDAALDSVILQMSYKYVYGDTITPQTLLVHEMSGDLYYDNKYLSSYDIKKLAYPEVIGSKEFIPKFRTNAAKTDTTSQILRIPLDPSLGNRLLKMDSLDMVSNDKFVTVFKGLFVETAPVSRKGSLISVASRSGVLVVYYHTAAHDSLGFGYYLTPNSADVSGYTHDYSTTKFFANMNQDNVQDSLVFLQPTGGTKVFIKIPTLSAWKDSTNYAINKATLTFHVDTLTSDFKRYEMPVNLFLKIINDDGEEELPKDAGQSLVYYGGIYNSTYGTYTFSITQYLQQIIAGEKRNNGFLLVHPERNLSPKRVVLKGAKSSRPIELEIVYTRYK